MPYKAQRPCRICGELTRTGAYCERHRREVSRQADEHRPSAAKRGYGHRWRKLRGMYLRSHPVCVVCRDAGRIVEATEVDHIVAKRAGGTDHWNNLQALCKPCHSRKTAMENQGASGAMTPVTLVAGPPGAGKTTYASERIGEI